MMNYNADNPRPGHGPTKAEREGLKNEQEIKGRLASLADEIEKLLNDLLASRHNNDILVLDQRGLLVLKGNLSSSRTEIKTFVESNKDLFKALKRKSQQAESFFANSNLGDGSVLGSKTAARDDFDFIKSVSKNIGILSNSVNVDGLIKIAEEEAQGSASKQTGGGILRRLNPFGGKKK